MAWYNDVWDFAKENALELAKMGGAGAKAYIDIKDQKRRNELEEAAYRNYMANVEAAGKEAQAAIDLNLMPMEISNVPTSKADVSDFTAVAARGGLMNLPTRHRKRYGIGTEQEDIEIMEPESLGDFELQKEEGVNIGPMAGFPDTGDPMSNAQQVWQSGAIDQGIYQMDFNIFFQSGDWMDYISKGKVQENMHMASSELRISPQIIAEWEADGGANGPYKTPQEYYEAYYGQMAGGGIAGLRHGGRPGYEMGLGPVSRRGFMTEEEASLGNPGNAEMYEEEIRDNQTGEIDGMDMINTGDGIKIVISGGNDSLYQGEPLIVQDITTGKYIVMGNDGRRVEFETIEEAQTYSKQLAPFKKGGIAGLKKGGRVKYAQGSGIMNLGGLEKDYRTTGGFVPIGGRERADDVPARLSKNEFVMTADAVRAAGGGSINKGAQRMYDTMKHLEAQPQAKRMTA